MSTVSKRYPLSTADGKYIPLEVLRPKAFIRQAITNTAGTTGKLIPEEVEILKIRSSVAAMIKFSSTSPTLTAIANDTTIDDAIYLPPNEDIILSPPVGKYWYSIISESAGGFSYMQYLEIWNALSLQSQLTRR